ncbi:hypothetical protein JHD47_06055 [Sulfurimonas sp. SAG-AH-194-L11]|nr:hypothetical protein [Sulfurimonas sp. SAG-AH-194-L11]MDF1877376.1 hypothetical protein [Sulfurimonas sp. SAG-AH-194-L11]
MIKKAFITSLVATTLLFTGCGDEASEGEDALVTQQLLDKGEFSSVIARIEPTASTSEDYLTLAAAYMGKAGFGLSKIIGIVATSATATGGNEFSSFIDSASANSTPTALNDLDIAVVYYQKVLQNKCLDKNITLGAAEADLCLYVGLANVSSTAVTFGYIADDVSVLSDNTGRTDDKLTASTCALEYAFSGTISDANCTASAESNITFIESNRTYSDINITVNAQVFEYLLTPINPLTGVRSTAITNGKCTLNSFSTRVDDSNVTGYYACPITESSDVNTTDITTDEILVNGLNNGLDSIGASVSADVQSDIDKFKEEILVSSGRSINDANTTITTQDIINYLNSNN